MMNRTRHNSGFTLLELTCALFIITTAGFGALQLYNVGLDKIMEMREFDVAAEVLRNEMEQLRACPFDALTDKDHLTKPTPALESLHAAKATVRATALSSTLKEVTVSLSWQGRHGRSITRALTTRIVDFGGAS